MAMTRKDSGRVNEWLNDSCQCALATQKANHTLRCIQSSGAGKARQGILPFCSSEISPGVLCPALRPLSQGRCGPTRTSPVEGPQDDQRAPLLQEKLREEKALERPFRTFLYLNGAYERAGEGLLTVACIDRKRVNGLIAEGG
ncbi:hypothetical protein DUI87_20405 [Hirundo rustica rustica]|uniref:Uncharacterized protein n=1 Tax=Hirundo rustica rustica TaxID=333673 RepID=A0A3M0JSL3_HIRRU|nr:hypothetical protein DUI87_20405 [Hirundo rustica rustica]